MSRESEFHHLLSGVGDAQAEEKEALVAEVEVEVGAAMVKVHGGEREDNSTQVFPILVHSDHQVEVASLAAETGPLELAKVKVLKVHSPARGQKTPTETETPVFHHQGQLLLPNTTPSRGSRKKLQRN